MFNEQSHSRLFTVFSFIITALDDFHISAEPYVAFSCRVKLETNVTISVIFGCGVVSQGVAKFKVVVNILLVRMLDCLTISNNPYIVAVF